MRIQSYTPTLKKSEHYVRHFFAVLALVAFTFSAIQILSSVQHNDETPVLMDKVIVSSPIPEYLEARDVDAQPDSVSHVDKLLRFEKLQGKVLMNQFAAIRSSYLHC